MVAPFGPGSAALPSNGSYLRLSRPHFRGVRTQQAAAAVAAASAAVGAGLYLQQAPQRLPAGQRHTLPKLNLKIPRELAEIICGAVGEIAQVSVLYPLDTIKVRLVIISTCRGSTWRGSIRQADVLIDNSNPVQSELPECILQLHTAFWVYKLSSSNAQSYCINTHLALLCACRFAVKLAVSVLVVCWLTC